MCVTKVYSIKTYVQETYSVVEVQRGSNVVKLEDVGISTLLSDNAYLGHVHRVHRRPWLCHDMCPSWLDEFEIDMLECIPVRVRLFI